MPLIAEKEIRTGGKGLGKAKNAGVNFIVTLLDQRNLNGINKSLPTYEAGMRIASGKAHAAALRDNIDETIDANRHAEALRMAYVAMITERSGIVARVKTRQERRNRLISGVKNSLTGAPYNTLSQD